MTMATLREQIIALLSQKECSARVLSQALGMSEKAVYEHIPHIIKTVSAKGENIDISPACCLSCGFEFKNRKRPTPPSRCPACRGERIDPPIFRIRGVRGSGQGVKP
jgi:predicted Zn-ribbon and HTH transcriptional regulator